MWEWQNNIRSNLFMRETLLAHSMSRSLLRIERVKKRAFTAWRTEAIGLDREPNSRIIYGYAH